MSVAIAAHAVGKDAQLHCLLSAVGLRNAAGSDIVTCLDVCGCRLHPGDNHRIVRERQGDRAAGRFDVQRFAIDLIDDAGNTLGLLLSPCRGDRK